MSTPSDSNERKTVLSILGTATQGAKGLARWRWAKWALAGVALLTATAAYWLSGDGARAMRYITAQAQRDNLTVIVTATGSVQPTKKVDVSSELSGTVRKVLVDYNSPVKAGQTLAELDTDKLSATLDSSRARLETAKAKVAEGEATVIEKQRDLMRKRTLASKQFTSAHDLDVAQAAYERANAAVSSARADVGVAEAELKLNQTNLAKACICSPIDGVILKRNVDPGQTVASSLQAPVLFSIAQDLRQMELQVDVDEADVGQVRVGQRATFTVDAFADRRFPATIRDVRYASEIIQGVVTYKAVLDIDNSELLLRPGMTATAEIRVTEIADALLVPNAALRYQPPSNNDSARQPSLLRRIMPGPPQFRPAAPREETGAARTVWALQNGVPAPVKVTIGASDGKRTEIAAGDIKPGQQLVIDHAATKKE